MENENQDYFERVERVLVARLLEYFDVEEYFGMIWGVSPLPFIDSVNFLETEPYDPYKFNEWSPERHAARVRYLMSPASGNDSEKPIFVDNHCDWNIIYAEPIIEDGNHRFLAHILSNKKWINVEYGGRCDLLDYLTGRSDEKPE